MESKKVQLNRFLRSNNPVVVKSYYGDNHGLLCYNPGEGYYLTKNNQINKDTRFDYNEILKIENQTITLR